MKPNRNIILLNTLNYPLSICEGGFALHKLKNVKLFLNLIVFSLYYLYISFAEYNMVIEVEKNDLILLIKETIRETIKEEMLNLYLSILPKVRNEELEDIQKNSFSKSDDDDYLDITDWVKDESTDK